MNKTEFLEELQDVLQRDDALTADMALQEIPEWDSLAMMAVVAFFDRNFDIKLTFNDFKNFKTVEDLIIKAGL